MPEKSSALVAGPTGLVGSLCLEMLLASGYYETITALTRRPIDRRHSRLVQTIVDFDNLRGVKLPEAPDVFCALGTTIRRAGSQEAFRKVDFEYPKTLATRCAGAGTEQFLLVSSVGADSRSGNFYLRVKGELEKAVKALPFQATHIFRPSILIGERAEKRAGEAIGIAVAKALGFLLIGKLRKYRGISAVAVAAAMLGAAKRGGSGSHVCHYDEILGLAGAFMIEPIAAGLVRGFLHRPAKPSGDAIVLTHGAGSNCQAPLLVEVAGQFADAGLLVLRCDLPFRQVRPGGPPSPGGAAKDREGLRAAADALRQIVDGRVFMGGHSYGGRQATMLGAEDSSVADALLLLSYPLHPPRRPGELRTAHFPKLATPAVFVHGSRDPFGTPDEMRAALGLISAATELVEVAGAGHDLKGKGAAALALKQFLAFTFSRYNSGKQL